MARTMPPGFLEGKRDLGRDLGRESALLRFRADGGKPVLARGLRPVNPRPRLGLATADTALTLPHLAPRVPPS